MTEDLWRQAIALYDRFTHEGMDRRVFMTRMIALAGSVAAAEALVGAIGASSAAAAIVPADDPRLSTQVMVSDGDYGDHSSSYELYVAKPRQISGKLPTVVVIHENRGLNEHTRDVARRIALAGFIAVAPDMLMPLGGTPENEDTAREMIGKLDLGAAVTNMTKLLASFLSDPDFLIGSSGKVGAVGFCWGGAFVNRLAVAAGDKLDAGVVYYGPAPDPAEAIRVEAPLMIHVPELDDRVKATAWPWVKALRAAGKQVTAYNYPGANHAFNNDTSAERYDEAAAELAWKRTLRHFRRHLS